MYYKLRHQISAILLAMVALIGALSAGAEGNKSATTKPAVIAKRGVSTGGKTTDVLKAGWYYSWYIDPTEGVVAEFVPMISNIKNANSWYYDRINKLKNQGKITCLLGFNEPERKEQGDTTVEQAIGAWPALMKTGLRLGSPAVSSDAAGKKWLEQFMAAAEQKKLRVDFLAVHWYGDISEGNAARHFEDFLTDLHNKYHRPIWITEFAGMNWSFVKHPVTLQTNIQFLTQVEPWLEKTDFIERYCWFCNKSEANLFAERQKLELNQLGEVYRDNGVMPKGK